MIALSSTENSYTTCEYLYILCRFAHWCISLISYCESPLDVMKYKSGSAIAEFLSIYAEIRYNEYSCHWKYVVQNEMWARVATPGAVA